MRNKILICLIFAVFGLALHGCKPEAEITGMVWEDQNGTSVPGTAVLAMIWLEDADNMVPKPDFSETDPEKQDALLTLDMEKRGQPSAYARGFADDKGYFNLNKFNFSAETQRKARQLKNPVVSRVTLFAFAKGYLKSAATIFPKTDNNRIAPLMLLIGKPKGWYKLYSENTVDSLAEKHMRNAYSAAFGANEEEKAWMLDYTYSNLWKAYTESDITGDEYYQRICEHDYSDVLISSAGMQRNPEHEKCAYLLKHMGGIRAIKEEWMRQNFNKKPWAETVKNLVNTAVAALPAEYGEPKEYAAKILEGIDEAAFGGNALNAGQGNYRNGLSDVKPGNKATLASVETLYNKGDKAGAYKAIGGAIYSTLSATLKTEAARSRISSEAGKLKFGFTLALGDTGATLSEIENTLAAAGLTVSAESLAAGIGRGLGGFHILMNRPQTAAAPGGDDGNHKDKPEVKESTETAKEEGGGIQLVTEEMIFTDASGKTFAEPVTNNQDKLTKEYETKGIKLKERKKITAPRLMFFDNKGGRIGEVQLEEKTREIKKDKQDFERTEGAMPIFSNNRKWVVVDRSVIETRFKIEKGEKQLYGGQIDTGRMDVYDETGRRILREEFPVKRAIVGGLQHILIADSGTSAVSTDARAGGGEPILYAYDSKGQRILEYSYANEDIGDTEVLKISPNGRYLAVRVGFNYAPTVTVFFDLELKKSWKADRSYVVHEITNYGLVQCDYYNNEKGEHSITKFMDIKPYLGN